MFVHFLVYFSLLLCKSNIYLVFATVNILDKGVLPLEKGSVGVQFYIDAENTNRRKQYRVQARPRICCLNAKTGGDCDSITVHGLNSAMIEPQNINTFVFVYPTLLQYDQIGFCEFVIEYGFREKRTVAVNVTFDTRLCNRNKKEYMRAFNNEATSRCESLDEDTLHRCNPVSCDKKYLGLKSYFDADSNKCVRPLACFGDPDKTLPDVVYVPRNNICRDLENPVSLTDIYSIKTGSNVVTEALNAIDKMKVVVTSNCTTISQNIFLLKDLICGRLCPILNIDTSGYIQCCTNAILSILSCVVAICAIMLSLVCCIHSVVWLFILCAKGEVKSYFRDLNSRIRKRKKSKVKPLQPESEVTNNLLRDVIIRDLPLDLRESVVDICERTEEEVRWKKRYRMNEPGSQVNFRGIESDSTEESSGT